MLGSGRERTGRSVLYEIAVTLLTMIPGFIWYYAIRIKREREHTRTINTLQQRLLGEYEEELGDIRDAWSIDWSDVWIGNELGRGAFGTAFEGQWLGKQVAVKVMAHRQDGGAEEQAELEREVTVMTRLRHPNLVNFYGAGKKDGGTFVVMELMDTSLRKVLAERPVSLSWGRRVGFALDIAAGMLYLHRHSMLHRDLKSDNVLVHGLGVAKVADFGTVLNRRDDGARGMLRPAATRSATATLGAGTLLWMAPEVLDGRYGRATYGLPADVYSFGMVLFELLTNALPWADQPELSPMQLTAIVLEGGRPTVPAEAEHSSPPQFAELMRRCWAHDAAARPTFDATIPLLEAMQASGSTKV